LFEVQIEAGREMGAHPAPTKPSGRKSTIQRRCPMEVKPDLTLDLKGLLCPMPVVKINQAIKNVPIGGVIEAYATDPGVMADIPAWCRSTGNELVTIEKQDKVIRFVVRRLK